MRSFHLRVAVIALASAACGLICVQVHLRAIATVGAVPLILLLPGSALVIAVDPIRKLTSVGQRLLWSIVASMALSILGGLVLNVMTSLDRTSWVALLCGIIGVSLIVGWIRAQRVGKGGPYVSESHDDSTELEVVASSDEESTPKRPAMLRAGLFLCAAVALVVGAVALSQNSVTTSNPKFIELWLAPTPIKAGASAHEAELGIRNLAGANINIVVRLKNGGQGLAREWYLSLPAGRVWSRPVSRQGTEKLVATVSYTSHPAKIVRYVDLKSPTR